MSTRSTKQPRVMIITTSHETLSAFFGAQLAFLNDRGFQVHAVCSPGPGLEQIANAGKATLHTIRMERKPSLFRDFGSLCMLWWLMVSLRPAIVHAHTPKAGLLGMLASLLAGVSIRLYTIHGLPLVTRTGLLRKILVCAERLSCGLAKRVYTVSASLRTQALELNLCRPDKLVTLGDGSCSGIDLARFDPAPDYDRHRAAIRRQFDIPQDALLAAFIGRIARDKGIEVLADAWPRLRVAHPSLHLLMCGAFDVTDPVPPATLDALRQDPRVHFTDGWVDDVPGVYTAVDLTVLPTYREGLSQVALESAAMKVPIVASRIPGLVNSVQDESTGLLVPPSDSAALEAAVTRLCKNPSLRRQFGEAGRQFVHDHFSQERVNTLVLNDYLGLIQGGREIMNTQPRPSN